MIFLRGKNRVDEFTLEAHSFKKTSMNMDLLKSSNIMNLIILCVELN